MKHEGRSVASIKEQESDKAQTERGQLMFGGENGSSGPRLWCQFKHLGRERRDDLFLETCAGLETRQLPLTTTHTLSSKALLKRPEKGDFSAHLLLINH